MQLSIEAHMCDHFGGKKAAEHVVEKRAKGLAETGEVHGTEAPGHISAGADAMRDVAIVLLLVALVGMGGMLPVVALGLIVWKTGRAAWLGWARLERLHRVIEQERYEITHHRPQEREELEELYRMKGFEGKLLQDVVDVLMADEDRLLRVMLEEELGLGLATYEHPLKQALGALAGAAVGALLCTLGLFFQWGVVIGAFLALVLGALLSAKWEGNRLLPSVVWNLSIGVLAGGVTYSISIFILRVWA
jgi:vacuolar iron transporter family protein